MKKHNLAVVHFIPLSLLKSVPGIMISSMVDITKAESCPAALIWGSSVSAITNMLAGIIIEVIVARCDGQFCHIKASTYLSDNEAN